jgi:hypothetical protein
MELHCRHFISDGSDNYDAAYEPDGDGRSDGDVLCSGGGEYAAQLSVAGERDEHFRGDLGQLHDTGDDEQQ